MTLEGQFAKNETTERMCLEGVMTLLSLLRCVLCNTALSRLSVTHIVFHKFSIVHLAVWWESVKNVKISHYTVCD